LERAGTGTEDMKASFWESMIGLRGALAGGPAGENSAWLTL